LNVRVAATRGTRELERAGVPFTVHTYRHDVKGAEFAAQALGIPLDRFAKTLVVDAGGEPVLCLVRGDRELSLKKLATARGVKHAALASERDAERLTGYLVGGISPFGTRRRLPVLVDDTLLAHASVALNGGQRGVIVELETDAVVAHLGAQVADLASA
jgi:Cys-tRNA(Pro)/Cys-tRNA(Cys) deacylase